MAVGLLFETEAKSKGFRFVAGVDEVGRGCLAGCVVAAAVVLDLEKPLPEGLNDSKKLSAKRREKIAEEIRQTALCYSIAQVEADEIDRINILQATKKAMISAVAGLNPAADFVLIDAVQLNDCRLPQKSIIGGDAVSASIAAASVIAKVYRDNLMRELDAVYPAYGFAKHAGYGTKAHFEALRTHGACQIHRKSFRGVLPVNL
ncbi:MAG TPA: ribonuclease HII [Pyrinomonadaceae bacterium]|jgi:ribonuclease HII